jgi:23S rRNA (cytosine1962-C5)-methyltransferase
MNARTMSRRRASLLAQGYAATWPAVSGGMICTVATTSGYALVDAGDGRRLERFGDRLVDRPAPTAADERLDGDPWARPDLRYDRAAAAWEGADQEPWPVTVDDLTLELRPTEAGQVGLFPEHIAMWPWLTARVAEHLGDEVLNLFAYTGATTLALARAGSRVAHVDGSRPAVAWARRNAALAGLGDARVRWLVDDAVSFAARERRRERLYRGVVLDPPAYGHAAGRAWRLEDDLDALLRASVRVLDRPGFILLTTHSVGWDAGRLWDALADAIPGARPEAGELELNAQSGAHLALGAFARVIIDE